MREIIIQAMAQALSNNIGQVLTHELATGIATVVSQAALQAEQSQPVVTETPTSDNANE